LLIYCCRSSPRVAPCVDSFSLSSCWLAGVDSFSSSNCRVVSIHSCYYYGHALVNIVASCRVVSRDEGRATYDSAVLLVITRVAPSVSSSITSSCFSSSSFRVVSIASCYYYGHALVNIVASCRVWCRGGGDDSFFSSSSSCPTSGVVD
jgi:hypothetical protein